MSPAKRVLLFLAAIVSFFAGWIMWNIPLNWSDANRNSELGWTLFGGGLATQLCLAPYLLFWSLSNKKESEKPEAESSSQDGKYDLIIKHYWKVLRDKTHYDHSFVKRPAWMDVVKWKHRPFECFGYAGKDILPKRSSFYREYHTTKEQVWVEADPNNPDSSSGYVNRTVRNYKIIDGRFIRGILIVMFLQNLISRIGIEFNIVNASELPAPTLLTPWLIVILLVCTDVFRGGKSKYYIPPDEQYDELQE